MTNDDAWVLALIIGLVAALIVAALLLMLIRAVRVVAHRATRRWRAPVGAGEWGMSATLAFSHGANDAQKTMGIIAVLLFTQGHLGDTFYVPFWVVIAAHTAMGLGTLAGGWRIVHTMGSKITRLSPMQGCAAETGAAVEPRTR